MGDDDASSEGRSAWRSVSEHPVISGVLATLIAAAILGGVSALWTRARSDAATTATCQDPTGTPLDRAQITATASSSHPDEGSLGYGPEKSVDGDTATAWVEGAEGLGVGESVTLELASKQDVVLVCVMNGYTSDQAHYQRNGRVRDYSTTTDQGSATGALDAGTASFQQYQQLKVATGTTTSIKVAIVNAVAGSQVENKSAYEDTAISDVIVYVK